MPAFSRSTVKRRVFDVGANGAQRHRDPALAYEIGQWGRSVRAVLLGIDRRGLMM
jgi:hypothetical protein